MKSEEQFVSTQMIIINQKGAYNIIINCPTVVQLMNVGKCQYRTQSTHKIKIKGL
jgi:hypothetical protein